MTIEMTIMKRFCLAVAALLLAPAALAQVGPDNLPASTLWYLHADLAQLRTAESGRELYGWLDEEAFEEVRRETGIDLSREADALTAFSDSDLGTVIVIEGAISQETRDKLLAIAAAETELDVREHDGKTYYFSSHGDRTNRRTNRSFDDLQETAFFTFDVDDRLIVASAEGQLRELLDNGGRLPTGKAPGNPLFVLTADRSFLQAGMRTDELSGGDKRWNSNLLRNTEQVALLVADVNDYIAVEAKLVSREAPMAQALGGIVRGLLSLQSLNSELEPEWQQVLANTKIDVKDRILSINAVIDPKTIRSVLDH